jgi:hypothetical protein
MSKATEGLPNKWWPFSAGLVQTVTTVMQKISCQDTSATAADLRSQLSHQWFFLTPVVSIVIARSMMPVPMEDARSFAIREVARHVPSQCLSLVTAAKSSREFHVSLPTDLSLHVTIYVASS